MITITDIEKITACYNSCGSIKQTSEQLGFGCGKVRKALITSGAYISDLSVVIADLRDKGMTNKQISEKLHVSLSTVDAHSPYTKGTYYDVNPTKNALAIRKHRRKMLSKKESV